MTVSFWIIGCCLECLNDVICSWLIQNPIRNVFLWENSPGAAWQIGVHPLILEGALQPHRINAASISLLPPPPTPGMVQHQESPDIRWVCTRRKMGATIYTVVKILKLHFFALLAMGMISSPPSPLPPTKKQVVQQILYDQLSYFCPSESSWFWMIKRYNRAESGYNLDGRL